MKLLSLARRPLGLRRLAVFWPALVFLCFQVAAGAAQAQISQTAEKRTVAIPAGDVVLAATLYRPPGATGDLAAVVTAHGSAASDREMMLWFTEVALDM